jgi:hypothetical protein
MARLLVIVSVFIAPSLAEPGYGFCDKSKLFHQDGQCCPQNINGADLTSIDRDASLMQLAHIYSRCPFKNIEYKNLSAIPNLVNIKDDYNTFDYGDVLPFLKNELVPESWIQCPGAMVTYAYMFSYVTVEGHPQTGTCNTANVEMIRVLHEVYDAERRVGFDLRTPGGASLWMSAFQGMYENKIQPIDGIDQAWVNSVFSRLQAINENRDVVNLVMATAITHIVVIQKQMDLSFNAKFEPPYVDIEVTLSLASEEATAIKGALIDNKGIYSAIMAKLSAECTVCPGTRSQDGLGARRFFGLETLPQPARA